jgi:1-acyl-sn-glycerol-3-phosphate acyltransferase
MIKRVWGLRSALFMLWLAATVVPWSVLMLILSIFVRGTRLYWPTMVWLRRAVWGRARSAVCDLVASTQSPTAS